MVMIKKAEPFVDMNGRFGGTYFRDDQCGEHEQAIPRVIDREPSPKQRKRRKAFRTLIHYWFNVLTFNEILGWSIYAAEHPKKNKKGETIYWIPFNWFVHFNIARVVNGLSILHNPPD